MEGGGTPGQQGDVEGTVRGSYRASNLRCLDKRRKCSAAESFRLFADDGHDAQGTANVRSPCPELPDDIVGVTRRAPGVLRDTAL